MSCTCGNKYHQPGCIEFLQSAPYCTNPCDDPTPCDQVISTDCVIYTGPTLECYGLVTGMTLTEVLDILFQATFPQCTTTTTTTAEPTTTSTTTTTTTEEPTTTTTTTLNPDDCVCYAIYNPTLTQQGAVIYPCGTTDPLEVLIDPETTGYYCVVNGTVPYEQSGNELTITACGAVCNIDGECDGCDTTTTTTII